MKEHVKKITKYHLNNLEMKEHVKNIREYHLNGSKESRYTFNH